MKHERKKKLSIDVRGAKKFISPIARNGVAPASKTMVRKTERVLVPIMVISGPRRRGFETDNDTTSMDTVSVSQRQVSPQAPEGFDIRIDGLERKTTRVSQQHDGETREMDEWTLCDGKVANIQSVHTEASSTN